MTNMLATTGLRRNEMRSLTTVEVDLGAVPKQGCRLLVGAPAKGGRLGEVIATLGKPTHKCRARQRFSNDISWTRPSYLPRN